MCVPLAVANKRKRPGVREQDLGSYKLLKPVQELLRSLRDESNPNRNLHYDHYATLLLFYFFNPALDSLRGLQASTAFPKVRKKLGIPRSSIGSLSAAQHVFDPELLGEILAELVAQVPDDKGDPRLREFKETVTAADGTLLRALPRIAWALWVSEEKRAAKAHVQFDVVKAVPSKLDITAAKDGERPVLIRRLEGQRLYVLDSGYASFALFQAVLDAGSSFVCRLPTGWSYEVIEERPLSKADREARVVRDVIVRLGVSPKNKVLKGRALRIVEIEKVDEPSKRMRRERPVREKIVLVTNRLDLPAELIAVIYTARWKIEIFFRWLKCVLGCQPLLAESRAGVELQLYAALISCLLISLWVGKKPTKRIFEAICLHFMGLIDAEDVMEAVQRLKPH